MSKKTIPVVKTSVRNIEIELPLYSYCEKHDDENGKECGIYIKVDKDLRTTALIVEYNGQWITPDDEVVWLEVSYKVRIIPHYVPNEVEIANRITKEQFLNGIGRERREFWKMYLDFLVKDYGK